MSKRRLVVLIGLTCLASWMLFELGFNHPVAHAQQPAATAESDTSVIRTETRLVLVDTVVTDKKGNYIRDLAQKDFKVWEDGKEQPLTSFSFEESTGATNAQPRYMVLFFDNSTMDFGDQAKARDAAAKFIDANAGPNRLIAIADFGGNVRISQNFTADAGRLKQVVKGIKGSAVSPNAEPPVMVASLAAPPAAPSLGNVEADFGVRSVLLALRSLAKRLATVPGRKTLVLLSSGFPLSFESQSEVTAVIDTCNKANVAIYPIDVRYPQPILKQHRSSRPHFTIRARTLTRRCYAWRPLLNRLPFCSMLAEAAEADTAAEEVELEVVMAVWGPAAVAPVAAVRQGVAERVAVRQVAAEPPAVARAVSVVEHITRASTVPTHSPGRSFRCFLLVLLTTSKCFISSRQAQVDSSS